jgi:phosphoribosylaminoimidazole-succinocarboxamide synthase
MIADANERSLSYREIIDRNLSNVLFDTDTVDSNQWPEHNSKSSGKVRDVFDCGDTLVIVTTDRQSAFDRNLAAVPYKGQVLNLLSVWWFAQTQHAVPNAFLAFPHPNVTVARKCTVFPIEFVVRGYITGSTATSMWTNYANGVRSYCGHTLPEGLQKNQKLTRCIITPTTKSTEHDALTSADEIVAEGVMSQGQWDTCAHYALSLFALGQELCAQRGLILVDTKYEFGVDVRDGSIRLVDELHTPDSSRFWVADSYEQRFGAGEVS